MAHAQTRKKMQTTKNRDRLKGTDRGVVPRLRIGWTVADDIAFSSQRSAFSSIGAIRFFVTSIGSSVVHRHGLVACND